MLAMGVSKERADLSLHLNKNARKRFKIEAARQPAGASSPALGGARGGALQQRSVKVEDAALERALAGLERSESGHGGGATQDRLAHTRRVLPGHVSIPPLMAIT